MDVDHGLIAKYFEEEVNNVIRSSVEKTYKNETS
jgi:hypothetical protein